MKLIIAGSRHLDFTDKAIHNKVKETLAELDFHGGYPTEDGASVPPTVSVVVSGKCPTGADRYGEQWASSQLIPVKEFPADWKKYGRAAGPIRNEQMAQYADALLLIWDGESRGSQNMKYCMRQYNKPVYEVIV